MLLSLALLTLIPTLAFGEPGDWPQWRGPNRDGCSPESGLLAEWPDGGPKLLWKAEGLGLGYAGVSLADGRIFTMGDKDDASHLIALHESDGATALDGPGRESRGAGLGWLCRPTLHADCRWRPGIHHRPVRRGDVC